VTASGRRTAAQSSGASAEQSAEHCLVRAGLEIVARNYRTRFGEIPKGGRGDGGHSLSRENTSMRDFNERTTGLRCYKDTLDSHLYVPFPPNDPS